MGGSILGKPHRVLLGYRSGVQYGAYQEAKNYSYANEMRVERWSG